MSLIIDFSPWDKFHARRNSPEIRRWLNNVALASEAAFKNMKRYPPASTPGQYPAIRSGGLRGSIKAEVRENTVEVSSNMPYSGYLRGGTSRMARRKMSDNALEEGLRKAGRLRVWAGWERG